MLLLTFLKGNLDMQYIMGISHYTSTFFWHNFNDQYDAFTEYLIELTESTAVPLVNSISWGAEETLIADFFKNKFAEQAEELAVRGVTIVAASGDDGAFFSTRSTSTCKCQYSPIFPASCPFITAVGATMGPENGKSEVTCQSNKGSVITSGGGFSAFWSRPSYQSDAVSYYFSNASADGTSPIEGYAVNKRGINVYVFDYDSV